MDYKMENFPDAAMNDLIRWFNVRAETRKEVAEFLKEVCKIKYEPWWKAAFSDYSVVYRNSRELYGSYFTIVYKAGHVVYRYRDVLDDPGRGTIRRVHETDTDLAIDFACLLDAIVEISACEFVGMCSRVCGIEGPENHDIPKHWPCNVTSTKFGLAQMGSEKRSEDLQRLKLESMHKMYSEICGIPTDSLESTISHLECFAADLRKLAKNTVPKETPTQPAKASSSDTDDVPRMPNSRTSLWALLARSKSSKLDMDN